MNRVLDSRRLGAATALLALLLAAITIVRIIVADPVGWFAITGNIVLLLATLYWYAFGRNEQRLLAALVGIGALVMSVHFVLIAPVSNLWNAVSALLLVAIAWLAGRRALTAGQKDIVQSDSLAMGQEPQQSGKWVNGQQYALRKMTLLVNPKSGGGKAEQFAIADKARAMGVDVRVLEPGDDLLALAHDAAQSGAEVLGMSGGDGSLGLVASVAMQYDLPFVCIPVGTRNHFAMDMNLDRSDPSAALAAFENGEERLIDVALVNDEQVVLNNASFGVYAAAVNEPGYREAKATAFRNVIAGVLNGEREPFDLRFDTPLGRREQALVVFVGNNPYEFIGIEDFGGRPRLDRGQLQITVLEAGDHDALAKLAQGMIIGNPDFASGFQQWTATDFEVDSGVGYLDVGVDGEALSFATPVRLSIRPRGLRVLVPAGTPLESPNPAVFTPEGLLKLGQMLR